MSHTFKQAITRSDLPPWSRQAIFLPSILSFFEIYLKFNSYRRNILSITTHKQNVFSQQGGEKCIGSTEAAIFVGLCTQDRRQFSSKYIWHNVQLLWLVGSLADVAQFGRRLRYLNNYTNYLLVYCWNKLPRRKLKYITLTKCKYIFS